MIIGDILADRQATGIPCLLYVSKLKEQGANITVLAGNHDEWAISFLLGKNSNAYHENVPSSKPLVQCILNRGQGVGIAEFAAFGKSELQEMWGQILCRERPFPTLDEEGVKELIDCLQGKRNADGNFWALLAKNAAHIASKLPEQIRREIVSMKLVHRIDHCLFVHTPPTRSMLIRLMLESRIRGGRLIDGVEKINRIFSSFVEDFLGVVADPINDNRFRGFSMLSAIFLDTGNRSFELDEVMGNKLLSEGITHVFYGHNRDGSLFLSDPTVYKKHGVQFIPVDFGYVPSSESDHLRSIARVKAGKICVGKELLQVE